MTTRQCVKSYSIGQQTAASNQCCDWQQISLQSNQISSMYLSKGGQTQKGGWNSIKLSESNKVTEKNIIANKEDE